MTPAQFEHTKVSLDNQNHLFTLEGKRLLFDGFTKVYDDVKTKDFILKAYEIGETLTTDDIQIIEKFTTPKPRFTEASLIKALEAEGIGRPSTYATVIQTIQERLYVEIVDKKFIPTEQGIMTSEKLDAFFSPIINVSYTAHLESDLDRIADREIDKMDVLKDFYNTFDPMLQTALKDMEKVGPKETGELCPDCGSPLVLRVTKFGQFKGCSSFPTCKYNDLKPKEKPKETGELCPDCGKPLVFRTSKKGEFIGCSGYPKCRHNRPLEPKVIPIDIKTS
jgi:DNA topoisomerase-1